MDSGLATLSRPGMTSGESRAVIVTIAKDTYAAASRPPWKKWRYAWDRKPMPIGTIRR